MLLRRPVVQGAKREKSFRGSGGRERALTLYHGEGYVFLRERVYGKTGRGEFYSIRKGGDICRQGKVLSYRSY